MIALLDNDRLIAWALALVVLYLAVGLLTGPLRAVVAAGARVGVGALVLWGINILGGPLGWHLAVNPASAAAVGLLGLPGLGLLLALRAAGF